MSNIDREPIEQERTIDTKGGAYIEGSVQTRGGDFVSGTKIVVGDVEASVLAIGSGAQIIYQNIERALTDVEVEEQALALARRQLAEAVATYVARLTREAERGRETAGPDSPYKALLEYDIDGAAIFYGRARAKKALLDRLGRGPLTVLHGNSGTGKTSLLKAGLMPELLAQGHVPLWLRPYRVPVHQEVRHQILRHAERTPLLAETSLHNLLGQVTDLLGGNQMVILVDQFEEVFDVQREEQRTGFLDQLARCLEDSLLPVRWVFALRGEYLSRLATFPRDVTNPFANEYLLQPLTQEQARQVIVNPAQARGVAYDPLVVDRLLYDLDQGGIEPSQLQLVCSTLFDSLGPNQDTIDQTMYGKGDAERILQDYLSRVIDRDIAPERRRAANLTLEALITSDGHRQQRTYRQLAGELTVRNVDRGVLDDLLSQLVKSRLVRPVEGPEESKDPAYELTHDYLVGRIQVDPAVQARKAVQEMLERAVLDYRDQGMLLDQDKFDAIATRQDDLVCDDQANALIRESDRVLSRRRLLVRGGVGLVIALGIIAVVLGAAIFGARQQLTDTLAESTNAAATVTVADALADEAASTADAAVMAADRAAITVEAAVKEASAAQAQQERAEGAAALASTREAVAQQGLQTAFERSGVVPVDSLPGDLAFDGTRLWVTQPASRTVLALAAATGRIQWTVHLDGIPGAVVFGERRVWVADADGGRIWVIDADTGQIRAGVQVSGTPVALAFDGSRVWVANQGDDTVQAIDAATETAGPPIQVPPPLSLAVVEDGLVVGTDHTVEVLSLEDGYPQGIHRLEGRAISVAGRGPEVWALRGSGPDYYDLVVLLWDGYLTFETNRGLPPGHEDPRSLIFAGGLLWLSDAQSDAILSYDPETAIFSGPIYVGADPGAMTFDGEHLWVANRGDATVQRITVPKHPLFGPISGGSALSVDLDLNEACSGEDGVPTRAVMSYGSVSLAAIRTGGNWTCEGGRVWTIEDHSLVSRDLTSGETVQTWALSLLPDGSEYSATGLAFAGGKLWLSAQVSLADGGWAGALLAVDPHSGELDNQISLRQFPAGLAYDGVHLWTVNTYDDTVQAIDPASYAAAPPIRLALQAGHNIVFDGKRVWIAGESGDLAQYVLVRRDE